MARWVPDSSYTHVRPDGGCGAWVTGAIITGGGTPMDDDHADDLLRRALTEPGASAAVALRVTGLPVSDDLTVIFHGRRDMGTIQTYVARGAFGAGAQLGADALMRVPCDLDLGDAEDRDEAERMYAEQAGALRDALVGADTVLG